MTKTNNRFFEQHLESFNQYQDSYLNTLHFPDQLLTEAVHYVMHTPGKKFRAQLVYACGELFQLPPSKLHPLALAIEMIHTSTLVHDDLPAMDNDDFRRGNPSCHKAFDEATAILVGNILYHMAFQLLLENYPPEKSTKICMIILKKIGPEGLQSGQNLDLKRLSSNHLVTKETLEKIHYLKTTTLLQAIVLSVAELGNALSPIIEELGQFTYHLGLAYQMFDDFGDIYATESWGKQQASDASNHKYTFARYYNFEELKKAIYDELNLAKIPLQNHEHAHYLVEMISNLENKLTQITSNYQKDTK